MVLAVVGEGVGVGTGVGVGVGTGNGAGVGDELVLAQAWEPAWVGWGRNRHQAD